ncbi:MBL fold metallo-hydrolase [Anaerolineales bacterium]
MEITWYGHNCFRLVERNTTTVVMDPHEGRQSELRLKGDLVTVSSDYAEMNAVDAVKGYQYVINGPGEYELGGVFVTGISFNQVDKEEDTARRNVGYMVDYESKLSILHLGNISKIPSQNKIERLGEIHVLMLPVGGNGALNADMASEVISLIEPNYVVPMRYALEEGEPLDLVDKFMKVMGVSNWVPQDVLRITPGILPEQPQVVVLNPQT